MELGSAGALAPVRALRISRVPPAWAEFGVPNSAEGHEAVWPWGVLLVGLGALRRTVEPPP